MAIGITSAVIAAASAATSAGMAASSAKEARRKEEKNRTEIEEEKRRRENLFNLRYHQDMTDRTEVQGMLRELREQQDAQRSQNEAKAAVQGDTKEQQIAEQQGLNKAYADSIAGIASNASMLKDGYLDNYENSLSNYYQQVRDHNTRMGQIEMSRSNQLSQAASNAASAMAGSMSTIAGAVDGAPKKAPAAGVTPAEQQMTDTYLNHVGQEVKTAKIAPTMTTDEWLKQLGKVGIGQPKQIVGYPPR